MQVLTPGTYTGGTVSTRTSAWIVNGVNKGTSYTPTEADRLAGYSVMLTETVTGTSGGLGTATSAASPVRRTEPAVAYNFGQLTPVTNGSTARWGTVQLKNIEAAPGRLMLGPGVAAPDTWTVNAATSGTDAHWNRTVGGNGYTPCRVSAIAGTYVFPVTASWTADGVTETQTVTITAKALTLTISEYEFNTHDFFTRIPSQGLAAADVAGGRVEFAVGFAPNNGIRFQGTQPTNRVTITYADMARPVYFPSIEFTACSNLLLQSLRTNDATVQSVRLQLTAQIGVYCSNINVDDYQHIGTGANVFFNSGTGTTKTLWMAACINCNVTNSRVVNVGEGLTADDTQNCFVTNYVVDGFYDNGMQLGGSTAGGKHNGLTLRDVLLRRPMRGVGGGQHLDFYQIADIADGGFIHINRLICAQAGGSGESQGFGCFNGSGELDLSVRGFIYAGRSQTAVGINKSIASTFDYFAVVRQNGTTYGTNGTTDTPMANGPGVYLDISGATHSGTIDKGFIFGVLNNPAGWTVGPNVTQFGYTNSSSLAARATMAAHFQNGDPTANLDALTDAAWQALSDFALASTLKAAVTPKPGDALNDNSPVDSTGNWCATVLAA